MNNMWDRKENKGHDIRFHKDFLQWMIDAADFEVEVKEFGWNPNGTFWPNTVHVLYRKKRLIDKFGHTTFFILNHECTHAVMIDSNTLEEKYLKEIPNKRHRSGEYMYDIPIEKCEVINLKEKYAKIC